jgi:hypothetical protein
MTTDLDPAAAPDAVIMHGRWDYVAFPCPKCGAVGGAPCVEPSGGRYFGFYRGGAGHRARGWVARAAWKAATGGRPAGFGEVEIMSEVWDFEGRQPRTA